MDKTILFYTDQTPAFELLTRFAQQHSYRLRRADDIVDVFAYTYKAAIIQRDLLEESLFGFLKEGYIDEVVPELEDMKEELQWEFEETFIVFGKGQEIPTAFKYFFIEVAQLTESTLMDTLKRSEAHKLQGCSRTGKPYTPPQAGVL